MKKIVVGLAVAATLSLASCSTSESASPNADTAASPIAATTTPAPTIRVKQVGEKGNAGCVGDSKCDIEFTVTSITRSAPCAEYLKYVDSSASNMDLVTVSMEVIAEPVFQIPEVNGVFLRQYWSVIGPDGFTTREPAIAAACGGEGSAGIRFTEPGIKERSVVPLIVPAGSTAIRIGEGGRGWEWTIPA